MCATREVRAMVLKISRELGKLTVILEAKVAGFVAAPFVEWANCTFFFLVALGVSARWFELLPANGGRHTTQYVI